MGRSSGLTRECAAATKCCAADAGAAARGVNGCPRGTECLRSIKLGRCARLWDPEQSLVCSLDALTLHGGCSSSAIRFLQGAKQPCVGLGRLPDVELALGSDTPSGPVPFTEIRIRSVAGQGLGKL